MKKPSSLLHKAEWLIFLVLCLLSTVGVCETLVVHGFLVDLPEQAGVLVYLLFKVLPVVYIIWVLLRIARNHWHVRRIIHDIVLTVLLLSTLLPAEFVGGIISFRMMVYFMFRFFRRIGLSSFLTQARINPARILLVTFAAAISIGVMLLMLPAATVDRLGANFIDALFTATSATCVTGLIVRDTGSYFTEFGQLVILVLIQIGGLGIMTLSTLFALMLGRKLGFRQEEQMRDILDQSSTVSMYKLIVKIFSITFVFEFIGAILLFIRFKPSFGYAHALKSSLFHSISAFCNAGFSLYPDSLSAFAGDWTVNLVIMTLIICGGLGFVVIDDIMKVSKLKSSIAGKWVRLTVHSRLVLIMTFILTVAGTMAVFFFEIDNTLLDFSTVDKLLVSLFQTVTLRTAGFNTIDIAALHEVTLFVGMLFMFIGASPASTGGGIKTTTFAVLLLSIRCLLRSRDEVELFGRTIHHQTVYKSIAILMFSFTFLVISALFLLSTQAAGLADILFEAISAIGTVGLSTGVTQILDVRGKLIIIVLMYVGRIGPLTVALALGEVRKVHIEYPQARVTVG